MARAPQALGSPMQSRSQYLARALEEMKKEPQHIGGYGDLGARLLAQALTQRALGKTEDAARAEASNVDLQRRQQIGGLAGLEVPGEMQEVGNGRLGNPFAGISRMMGVGGQPQPQQAPPQAPPMQAPIQPPPPPPGTAPVAPVEGGPIGPAMPAGTPPMPPMPQGQMAQDPQGQAPQQPQMPPQMQQQVQYLLSQGTPEAYQQAEQIVFGWQQQQAALASVPPEMRNDPRFMYAAANNPEALAESLAYQYRPQVIAAGGIQSIAGENRQIGAPRFDEFGDQMVRVDPVTGEVSTVAQRGPTYAEQTDRMQAEQLKPVEVGEGGALVAFDPRTGEALPQFERAPAEKPLSAAEQTAIDALETDIVMGDQVLGNVRSVIADIDSGAFRLDPMSRTSYEVRNRTGQASPESLAYARALTTVSNLRNTLLRENKGTQTEGDAIRTLEEVIANWGDEEIVRQGLQQFERQQAEIQEARRGQIERRRSGEARRPTGTAQGQAGGRRLSPEEAQRLPPGTPFVGLDGVPRVRQ